MIMVLALVAACGPTTDVATPGGGTPTAPTAPTTPTAPAPPPPTPPAEPPREGANLADHINIAADQAPITVLNSNLSGQTGGSALVMRTTHDRLIEVWGAGDYRPGLATSWYTDDFQTIRLNLREGVRFHNGDPFTADCVQFTFEVSRDYHQTGTAWARFRAIREVVVVDRYTVDIIFNEPDPDFEFTLSHWAVHILSSREWEERGDDPAWALIGTGAYRIIEFSPGNVVHVERNEDFWGDPPPTRSVSWWTIPEMSTRNVMLQTGDLQIANVLSAEDTDAMYANPDFQVIRDVDSTPQTLFFNAQSPDPFIRCLYFRKAVAHAINVVDVAIVADGNWAQPWGGGSVWGGRAEFFRTDLPTEFSPTLAMEYLERSVWNGETLVVAVVPGLWARAAEMVQLQLGAVGIDVELDVMESATLISEWQYDPDRTNQAALHWLPFSPTALGAIRANLLGGVSSNRMNINSPFLQEQHDILAVTHDREVARQIAYDIQEYLWENMVAVPLFLQVYGITTVPGVGGIHLWGQMPRANFTNMYWDMDQAPDHLRP